MVQESSKMAIANGRYLAGIVILGVLATEVVGVAACSDDTIVFTNKGVVDASVVDGTSPVEDSSLGSDGSPPADGSTGQGDGSTKPDSSISDGGTVIDPAAADAALPEGTVSGVDVSAALQDFALAYSKTVCERVALCCSRADYDSMLARFSAPPYVDSSPGMPPPIPAPSDCETTLTPRVRSYLARYASSIARRHMAYSATRAAKCIADIGATACGPALFDAVGNEECLNGRRSKVFIKIAPPGVSCEALRDSTLVEECDPKLGYCEAPASSFPDGRKCVPWRKEGAG
jgi:hypothetical protein